MKRKDLIGGIAYRMGEKTTKKEVSKFLNAFEETVKRGIEVDGKVQMAGFLTFEVKDTKERKGYNVHSGEMMTIPAGKRVTVRLGQPVKNLVK